MQAAGARAGRQIFLTIDDVHALQTESDMIAVVSAELQRGAVNVKSAYNAAAVLVDGIEPQYQDIRTIEVDRGRLFNDLDEREARRVAIVGFDATTQLFSTRQSIGETVHVNGIRSEE